MHNIILAVLYITVIAVNHFRYSFLLSGDTGNIIIYLANVFVNPLALSFIISITICVTVKKRNSASYIRGTCWFMGMILAINSYYLWQKYADWNYTFTKAKMTITVPNKRWVSHIIDHEPHLVTLDAHASITILSSTQDERGIHSFDDLALMQRSFFREKYHHEEPPFHPCTVKGFKCAYQDYLDNVQTINDGKVKRTIMMTLLDTTDLIFIIAAIDPEYEQQYREKIMEMMYSVRHAEK